MLEPITSAPAAFYDSEFSQRNTEEYTRNEVRTSKTIFDYYNQVGENLISKKRGKSICLDYVCYLQKKLNELNIQNAIVFRKTPDGKGGFKGHVLNAYVKGNNLFICDPTLIFQYREQVQLANIGLKNICAWKEDIEKYLKNKSKTELNLHNPITKEKFIIRNKEDVGNHIEDLNAIYECIEKRQKEFSIEPKIVWCGKDDYFEGLRIIQGTKFSFLHTKDYGYVVYGRSFDDLNHWALNLDDYRKEMHDFANDASKSRFIMGALLDNLGKILLEPGKNEFLDAQKDLIINTVLRLVELSVSSEETTILHESEDKFNDVDKNELKRKERKELKIGNVSEDRNQGKKTVQMVDDGVEKISNDDKSTIQKFEITIPIINLKPEIINKDNGEQCTTDDEKLGQVNCEARKKGVAALIVSLSLSLAISVLSILFTPLILCVFAICIPLSIYGTYKICKSQSEKDNFKEKCSDNLNMPPVPKTERKSMKESINRVTGLQVDNVKPNSKQRDYKRSSL